MSQRKKVPLKVLLAVLALFAVASALRMAVAVPGLAAGDDARFVRPDTPGYLFPALALAAGEGYPGSGRVPGFPALAAAVLVLSGEAGGEEVDCGALVVTLALLGGVSAVVVMLAGMCCSFRVGVVAGVLYALNLTAVANAPMLLSDTFFGFVAALQFWFFMLFRYKHRRWCFLLMVLAAALGALIRPINLLWIFPALALLAMCFEHGFTWRRKLVYGISGAMLFAAVLLPWMIRNASMGAGFTLDTNTGAVYHQNGAMLLAEVNGTDFESEKARLLRENEIEFSDPVRYPDEASREAWRLGRYRDLVLEHPLVWLRQSASWKMLLPDAPTFWELCGVTVSGRGTMGVMAKYGFFAGVRHYFGGNAGLLLFTLLLLLPTLAMYFCALGRVVCDICLIRLRWYELVAFLAFAEYYLLLPGAITAPRYQIPALPVLCVMAACFIFTERESGATPPERRTEDENTDKRRAHAGED